VLAHSREKRESAEGHLGQAQRDDRGYHDTGQARVKTRSPRCSLPVGPPAGMSNAVTKFHLCAYSVIRAVAPLCILAATLLPI